MEADTDFRNNSLSLVNKITKLLERLVDYRNIKPGDEHRNQKLSCIVNLMVDLYETRLSCGLFTCFVEFLQRDRPSQRIHPLHTQAVCYP